jgi:hypothetical protein
VFLAGGTVSEWNSLTTDLKNAKDINSFKQGLFKKLFNKDIRVG